jgi:hypothetical protein
MKKMLNSAEVQGYIFSHNLQERQSKKTGQDFIMGDIEVATDDKAMTVVKVHFGYVTPTYKNGNENATYAFLKQIIEEDKTYEKMGTEAQKVRISSAAIESNDFFSSRSNEIVEAKRIRGSFCSPLNGNITIPSKFDVDMLIDTTVLHEDEEQGDWLEIKGNVFDYRGDLVPVSFSVTKPEGIAAFEGMDISKKNPALVHLYGKIVTNTVVKEVATDEEMAFGAPAVNTTSRSFTAWEVEGASQPMEFDDESTITIAELQAAIQRRADHLAQVKKDYEEYQASRSGGFSNVTPGANATTPDDAGFVF